MTRPIKFRLIRDNKIVGYEIPYQDPNGILGWEYQISREIKKGEIVGTPGYSGKPIRHDIKNQDTGLKDKNGKEIYEGDILKLFCSTNENHIVTATVEWIEDGYVGFLPRIHNKKVKVIGGPQEGKIVSMGEMHGWCGTHHCFSFSRYLEVIGNIYQDKNLLLDQKP